MQVSKTLADVLWIVIGVIIVIYLAIYWWSKKRQSEKRKQ